MTVDHLEVLVEERSAEAALAALLPRILGQTSFAIYPHQGKRDLLRKLPERLRGYSRWLPATWRIAILVDQDDDDCQTLKQELESLAAFLGMPTPSQPTSGPLWTVVNRIAVQELEAWFFGDWEAVVRAYPRVSPKVPARARYRDPDAIPYTWEALERELKRAGYFAAGLPKVTVARAVAEHMEPSRNRSHSFQVFRSVLQALVGA